MLLWCSFFLLFLQSACLYINPIFQIILATQKIARTKKKKGILCKINSLRKRVPILPNSVGDFLLPFWGSINYTRLHFSRPSFHFLQLFWIFISCCETFARHFDAKIETQQTPIFTAIFVTFENFNPPIWSSSSFKSILWHILPVKFGTFFVLFFYNFLLWIFFSAETFILTQKLRSNKQWFINKKKNWRRKFFFLWFISSLLLAVPLRKD